MKIWRRIWRRTRIMYYEFRIWASETPDIEDVRRWQEGRRQRRARRRAFWQKICWRTK